MNSRETSHQQDVKRHNHVYINDKISLTPHHPPASPVLQTGQQRRKRHQIHRPQRIAPRRHGPRPGRRRNVRPACRNAAFPVLLVPVHDVIHATPAQHTGSREAPTRQGVKRMRDSEATAPGWNPGCSLSCCPSRCSNARAPGRGRPARWLGRGARRSGRVRSRARPCRS